VQPAVRGRHRVVQAFEEAGAGGFVAGLGEDLLKLVDDQQQAGGVIGQDLADDGRQAAGAAAQPGGDVRRGVEGDAQQGSLQLGEGIGARLHPDDEPARRAADISLAQHGDHAGLYHAGLAAAAGADHRQEAPGAAGILQPPEQPGDQGLAAKELAGVGFLKSAQALVGVLRLLGLSLEHDCGGVGRYVGGRGHRAAGLDGHGSRAGDDLAEIGGHGQHTFVARLRLLGGGVAQYGVDLVRQLRTHELHRRQRVVDLAADDLDRLGVSERDAPGQGRVEHDAQAVDVRLRRDQHL